VLVDLIVLTRFSRIGRRDGEPKTVDLRLLLRIFRDFLATDSKNKVFALLGMATRGHSFPVDYSASPRTLYVETAWYLLEEGWKDDSNNNFKFLADVNHDLKAVDTDYPSWVPQWNCPRAAKRYISDTNFKAGREGNVRPTRSGTNNEVLQAHGYVVSEIEVDIHIDDLDVGWNIQNVRVWNLLRSILQLAPSVDTGSYSVNDWYEAYSQVLTTGANYFISRDEPPTYGSKDFQYVFTRTFVEALKTFTDEGENIDALADEWRPEFQNMCRAVED